MLYSVATLFPIADFLLNLSVDHNLCGHAGFVELCRHHVSKETVIPLRQASLAKLQDLHLSICFGNSAQLYGWCTSQHVQIAKYYENKEVFG